MDAPDPEFPSFDPRLAAALTADGSELVEGLAEYLGMRVVEARPGVTVVEARVRPELVHRFGAVHGGVVATLVDHVLGAAVFPLVPLGTWPATLEFKLNYLAAARDGVLRATGRVLSLRRRTAVVQVEVVNEGRTVAVALGTISLNSPRPEGGGAAP
ncbi:MAG TPA: PaaI family thioesterase [Acidimicrobiales bacterium]|nr:PaaI family thioesterase [Acidimicrobiales bacterium]